MSFLEFIRVMRSGNNAPVDRIGCHMLHDKNEPINVYFFISNSYPLNRYNDFKFY